MMVTLVSQCEKHALKRTRRVLDAFANRIGDNTWQTLITEDGLQTVKKMLRQSASRNTAVSCHWIRSRGRSQLLWVVGQKNKFNPQGYVPVNRTEKSLLGSEHENDWKYLSLINAFARLAALFHDWGKASRLFQDKLKGASGCYKGDPLRHEWVSALLFNGLVKSQNQPENDESWLDVLISSSWSEQQLQQWALQQKLVATPLSQLPDAAGLLSWLIVSHHKLPVILDKKHLLEKAGASRDTLPSLLETIDKTWGYENRIDEQVYQQRIDQCFEFPNGLLTNSTVWRTAVSKAAEQIKQQLPLFKQTMDDGSWRLIAQHARLCLMLADHNYSSKDNDPHWNSDIPLYANTHYIGIIKQYKQKLDEHLVNVAEIVSNISEYLPFFETELPIEHGNAELAPKINQGKFGWQEEVVKQIYQYRDDNNDKVNGFFVVNMASTGCGKTLANAKIMQALSDDKQTLRFIFALGLRTLTLQTGKEYRDRIYLPEDKLAVIIGSKAVAQLHQEANQEVKQEKDHDTQHSEKFAKQTESERFKSSGSESQESLSSAEIDELHWGDQTWQGRMAEDELSTVLKQPKDRALLYAPVLVCTIDHIIGSTETTRGGRYILPYLRLLSSDLVIDEVDDFINSDPIAIARLVNLAGMLGRKVMISSATITPDSALVYFQAYQAGWLIHANSRQQSPEIGCVWVDEGKYEAIKNVCKQAAYTATISANNNEAQAAKYYQQHHEQFIARRVEVLKQQPARRKASIVATPRENDVKNSQSYFTYIQKAIIELHQRHLFHDNKTGISLSFGVVRVANISLCVDLTRYLLECEWPEDIEIRTMAYHSQQVLLLRHEQEQHLDAVLKRKEADGEVPDALKNPTIRRHLDGIKQQNKAKQVIFILVATPVEEVGRDHDFDWAVIEPSSYRSIIQMSGRVRRHREGEVTEPNIGILQYNWKGFLGVEIPFSRPGYENEHLNLATHDLKQLVDEQQLLKSVDAIPRIQKPNDWETKILNDLASFEHYAISQSTGCESIFPQKIKNKSSPRAQNRTIPISVNTASSLWGYTHGCWWMTALPQQFKPFRQGMPSVNLSLMEDQDNEGTWVFQQYDKISDWIPPQQENYSISYRPLDKKLHKRLWLVRDYISSIKQYKNEQYDINHVAKLYGEINFLVFDKGKYHYDDQLGMVMVKS